MSYGIRVNDALGNVLGVWWTPDENTEPELIYLDDIEQGLADNQLDDMRIARRNHTLAPVERADGTVEPADWIDALLWKTRPSLHVMIETADGPYITDTPSAQAWLDYARKHKKIELPAVDRVYIP